MSRPILHFAHANGVPSATYRKMLDTLHKDFEVVCIPVIGTNPDYPVGAHWSGLIEQVADSIRRQSDRPVIAVGHSMGGVTSYMAAHRYPALFRNIIMLDPPIINGWQAYLMHFAKLTGRIDQYSPAARSSKRREYWPTRSEAAATLHSKSLFKVWDEECFRDYIQHGLTDCPEGVRLTIPVEAEVEMFRQVPTNPWAFRRKLHIPGAIMVGKGSEFANKGYAERLARQQSFTLKYTGGGHMFPLERPVEVAGEIRDLVHALR